MKKIYSLHPIGRMSLFLLGWLLPLSLAADPVEIVVTEAGSASALFAAHAEATDLVIKGTINQLDLLELHAQCRKAERIDLSEATIEAYSDEESYVDYPANELSVALASSSALKELFLPKTLTSIVAKALQKCPNLTAIILPGESVVKAKSLFVDKRQLASIKLYVPGALVEKYKELPVATWGFSEVLPIKQAPTPEPKAPYEGVVFDNVYGPNYFPITEGDAPKIFFTYFFTNGSDKQIDEIEFTYWFDNNTEDKKTLIIKEVQLLPGSNMDDLQQACIFVAPNDTELHTIHIKPTKLNDTEVELGERTRPYRRYYVDHGYMRQHQLELFIDPKDPISFEGYKRALTSMITLLGKTRKPEKITLVTITGDLSKEGVFTPQVSSLSPVVKGFRINQSPLMVYDRDLMTVYGTLNNAEQLLDLSLYTPAVRIGSLENVYEYMFSNSFHRKAFSDLSIGMSRTTSGEFMVELTGKLSVDEKSTNDLRAMVYLVENSTLPTFDTETEMVSVAENTIYNRVQQVLSAAEGTPLEIREDGSFVLTLPTFKIEDYTADKYRLTAAIFRQGTTEQPYLTYTLQSASTAINEALLTGTCAMVEAPNRPSLCRAAGYLYTQSMEWSISHIYTLDGVECANGALAQGAYVVVLQHTSGALLPVKYIF